MNKLNHQLYMCICAKYKNTIIPNIPNLIFSYLLKHPRKIRMYLSNNFTIDHILNMLSNKYAENHNIDILLEIINYVEDEI